MEVLLDPQPLKKRLLNFFFLHYTFSQSTDTKYTILIHGWDLKISEMKKFPHSRISVTWGQPSQNCLLWLKVRLRNWVGGRETDRVAIVILYSGQRRKHRTLVSPATEKQGISTVHWLVIPVTNWVNIRFIYLVQGSTCWNSSTFILHSITQECPLKVSALLVYSAHLLHMSSSH